MFTVNNKDMKAYNFNDVVRGDSFGEKNIHIENETLPIDLTGVLIKCQFRRKTKTGELAKEITESDGIDIYDPTNGNFRIDDFIVDWVADVYFYDVQFTFTDNTVKTYFGGYVKVLQDVTQNA